MNDIPLNLVLGIFSTRRRRLGSLLVIVIAASIAMTGLGYVDTRGAQVLRSNVDSLDIEGLVYAHDYSARLGFFSQGDASYLTTRDYIAAAEPAIYWEFDTLNTSIHYESWYGPAFSHVQPALLAINPTFLPTFPTYLQLINGSWTSDPFSTLIHEAVARRFNLQNGSQVSLNFSKILDTTTSQIVQLPLLNLTVTGFFTTTINNTVGLEDPAFLPQYSVLYDYAYALSTAHDAHLIQERYFLDLSHDLINYLIPELSGSLLRNIALDLTQNLVSGNLRFPLLDAYLQYEYWLLNSRMNQLLVLLPLLGMGFVVLAILVPQGILDKALEIQMILARGAEEHQISIMVYRELLTFSLLGSAFATVLGGIMSQLLFTVEEFLLFNPTHLFQTDLGLTFSSILMVWIFTFVIIFGSGLIANRQWRLTTKPRIQVDRAPPEPYAEPTIPAEDTLPDPLQQRLMNLFSRVSHIISPLSILYAFALSIAFTFLYLIFINAALALPHQINLFLGLLIGSYVTLRLGDLIQQRIQKRYARQLKNYRNLIRIRRTIRRHDSSALLVIFLTISILFSSGSSMILSSFRFSAENAAAYHVGAHLQVGTFQNKQLLPVTYATSLRGITGVVGVTPLKIVEGNLGINTEVAIVGITPDAYVNLTPSGQGTPLRHTSKATTLATLSADPNHTVISTEIAWLLQLDVGDSINIGYTKEDGSKRYTTTTKHISGVVNTLPGVDSRVFVVLALTELLTLVNSTHVGRFLVTVADAELLVLTRILDTDLPFLDWGISATQLYESFLDPDFVTWLAQVATLIFIYATILTGVLFATYLYTGFMRHKREFTILRALGLNQQQMLTLGLSEILEYVIIAIGLGGLLGIVATLLTTILNLRTLSITILIQPQLAFIPFTIIFVLLLPALSASLGAYIVIHQFNNLNLPQLLKLDVEPQRAYRTEGT